MPDAAGVARALWWTAPNVAELRGEVLAPPGPGEVRVRTLFSGVSRGTEALVAAGRVPESQWQAMRCPVQQGEFPFPVKYGYGAVGTVEAGPAELLGRLVFALHPHQDRFMLPAEAVVPLPEDVPPQRAVLAANAETALNALWDAGALPGQRIVVMGAGVVGALVAWLAGRLPGAAVTLVDVDPARAAIATTLGVSFAGAGDAPGGADLVVEASGAPPALGQALALAGCEAVVLVLGWYGDRAVPLPLGEAFHSRWLRLVCSQVGKVAPVQRPRWSRARRLAKALELLADPALDVLISGESAFDDAPRDLPRVLAAGAGTLCHRIRYERP
ncbi:MAG TPA: zinc-binding alcohol dehydrogenase [Geminicoccaceae bacterium]|nr:zinc-binding alcohol dehydrogenase [Geminicoccaceae bacterium]